MKSSRYRNVLGEWEAVKKTEREQKQVVIFWCLRTFQKNFPVPYQIGNPIPQPLTVLTHEICLSNPVSPFTAALQRTHNIIVSSPCATWWFTPCNNVLTAPTTISKLIILQFFMLGALPRKLLWDYGALPWIHTRHHTHVAHVHCISILEESFRPNYTSSETFLFCKRKIKYHTGFHFYQNKDSLDRWSWAGCNYNTTDVTQHGPFNTQQTQSGLFSVSGSRGHLIINT